MPLFGPPKSLRRLEERFNELSDTQDALGRSIRGLRLEWEETYDKIHRLFSRMAKRSAIDNPPPRPPELEPGPDAPVIDEISAAILARRAKGKVA